MSTDSRGQGIPARPDGAASPSIGAGGPAWDLSQVFPSIESAEYRAGMDGLQSLVGRLQAAGEPIGARVGDAGSLDAGTESRLLEACRRFALLLVEANTLHGDLSVYAQCSVSVNASDEAAKVARGALVSLGARIQAASAAFTLIMATCPEPFFEAFLSVPETAPFRFRLLRERKLRARFLSLDVEKALSTMAPDGHAAWGTLYGNITGTVTCHVSMPGGPTQAMGLASASSLLKRPERDVREAAWRGINAAMAEHGESFAATLNAIAGWRHAEAGLRSHTERVHYLDKSLHQSRISRATLDALMDCLRSARDIGRRALKAQASLYGVDRLAPWDILAPAPARGASSTAIPFERGLEMVRRAYAAVDPAMGEFVDKMASSRRIEGRVMDGKRPGAFCTRFPGSRNPFVYTTYGGSLSELSTLAHELGHAYHGEVMRDLHLVESDYPMTLAETASTFAEALLADMLAGEASDEGELLDLAWADAQDAATFLVNIPSRFEFESRFYERRPSGPVGIDGLRELMSEAWAQWYGDALSGYDDYYWASKLHFHMSGVSFYNFPYSFGYLFSLGVYARRDELGTGFHDAYVGLLRDTGRMEAEDVAMKHLGADLGKQDFWQAGIRVVEEKVERFERLARAAVAPAKGNGPT